MNTVFRSFARCPLVQGTWSSFLSAGADPLLLKCRGVDVTDLKNGLPGADSILFNTATTHQALSLTNEERVVTKKPM